MKLIINGESVDVGGGSGGTVEWENVNGRPDLTNVATMKLVTVTLSASNWVDKEQIITIPGISADEKEQLITPVPSSTSYNAYYNSNIVCSHQSQGLLTFKADSVPTDDVTIYVYIQSVAEIGEEYVGTFEWWSPKMTANNAPAPYVASATSTYSDVFSPYKAFDGFLSENTNGTSTNGDVTLWMSKDNIGSAYLQIDFGIEKIISAFRINPHYSNPSEAVLSTPTNMQIYGSNDGESWTELLNLTNISWSEMGGYNDFHLESPIKYRYYKIGSNNVTGTYSGRIGYGDIQFYVLITSEVTQ